MILEILPVGELEVNCMILGCERSKEGVVIDPGDDFEKIQKIVDSHHLKIKYLLHTHSHFDHVGASAKLKDLGYGEILLHKEDLFLYEGIKDQGLMFGMPVSDTRPVDRFIECGDVISFGDHQIQVLHTPGHSPGSCCLVMKEENLVFSGDTLFRGSIGRTDFLGGDFSEIMNSIKNKLLKLEGDLKVIPGHGPSTSLYREKKTNPFLTGR